ncbi:hypothetical protein D3870_13695 [Noviherbaspirillum cavernae]|uniref:DUF4345 domain-containing protein n=1 Tax=Noviherbaspirillum cavernae TaxID=2320862 RepID=A0A418X3E5_9BURK|nr:hypothetical protein [Noviherbaspirillum cavernae]RJG06911.1 hypothetical protein D3870_13695 [Noviherbaspirillum cavernae]
MQGHKSRILLWTGIATMLPGLQFLFPVAALRLAGLDVSDPAGLFYARHWGLLALCMGALLVHAARNPEARRPIVFAATIEKAGLVAMVALAWRDPALQGLHLPAIFDGLCVILYSLYLWQSARTRPASVAAT